MRHKWQIFILFMALILAGFLCNQTNRAMAGESVNVELALPEQVKAGDYFTASVVISQVDNFDAANYDLIFDSSVLKVTAINEGIINSKSIPVDAWQEILPGQLRIVQNLPGLTGVSGSGYLARIDFQVLSKPGVNSDYITKLSFNNGVLGNNLAQEITSSWLAGQVKINPLPQIKVTGVTLSLTALTLTKASTPVTLTATVEPANATEKNVTWHSSEPTVATVSASGMITPVAPGTAIVTATTDDGGFTAECTVIVNPETITGIGGVVSLQGISGYAGGIQVNLIDELANKIASVTTDNNGRYFIDKDIYEHPISVGTYKVIATKPVYLSEASSYFDVSVDSYTVPNIRLLTGDISCDNQIDFTDLINLASVYDQNYNCEDQDNWIPKADLNRDNKISIFDLVLLAKNYNKVGCTNIP